MKNSAKSFIVNLIKVFEAKKQELFKEVEDKAQEVIERLEEQQSEVENELQLMIETSIEKTETLLKRSTNADIVHFNALFQDEVIDEAEISQTKSSNSKAEGKGITGMTVGLEAQFVLTTRNAENELCYKKSDIVTVETKNDEGYNCATEAQVHDNKDCSYFAKEAGTRQTSVMVNGEDVSCCPFTVQVKPRQYKAVLSFGGEGSSAGMFDGPWSMAVNELMKLQ